jgi:hypothetical protein
MRERNVLGLMPRISAALFSVDYPAGFIEDARNVLTLDVLERLNGGDIRPVLGPKHRLVDCTTP